MSVRLDDGLRLVDTGMPLFGVVHRVAAAIRGVFDQEARRIIAEETACVFDDPRLRAAHADTTLFTAAGMEWARRRELYGDGSWPDDPLRFSIVFGQAASGRVLAYPFHDAPAYRAALEVTGLFADWHYQNQADQPDDVDDAEWDARRRDWESVLDDDDTLSSLPMWQLPGSLTGVFSYQRADTDPNRYTTVDGRHAVILARHTQEALRTPGLDGSNLSVTVLRTVAGLAADAAATSARKPQPVPPPRTMVADLPPVFQPDPAVLAALLANTSRPPCDVTDTAHV